MTAPADLPRPHPLWCARERRFRALVRAGTTDPPAGVLHRLATEIRDCCGHHPIKAHRLAWGLTVRQAVAALGRHRRGLDERTWRRWEHGAPPDADYRNALGAFFRTGPVQLGLATDYTDHPEEAVPTGTPPHRLGVGSLVSRGTARAFAEPVPHPVHPVHPGAHEATAGSDDPHIEDHPDRSAIERQISMAAHESAEFHDRLAATSPAALDLLRDQARQVARSFANQPRLAVFGAARRLRDEAFRLLTDDGHLADSRDLYFLTGAACGMLAEITENFGFRAEAMAHARTGWLCAERSGHPGLMAWILAEQSLICYYDGRPAQAAEYARRGQQYPTTDSVSVWLPAAEARAAGSLGDADAARAALDRVRDTRDRVAPADLDGIGGILAFPVAKQQFMSADAYLGIGDSAGTISAAEACVAAYQDGPPEERAHDNEAQAHVDMASARVLTGDLDAAQAAVQPVFAIPAHQRIASLDQRLGILHRQLTAPAVATAPVAVDLRDQIEDFLAASAPALPGA